MRVSCLSQDKNVVFVHDLQSLGVRVQVEPPGKVKALSSRTTDLVYMVPHELIENPKWGEWRVSLARSSRYYIVYGEQLDSRRIVQAARDGAFDVIDQVDSEARILEAIQKAANAQSLWWQLYGSEVDIGEEILVGRSSTMKALRESIQRIGPTSASVLILGESGTGKERVAEATQRAFGRGEMVIVNCAAIPKELMESELFGAEKGAFTGANQTKPGLVEEADGGTLFLDEIGEMDIGLQPKLLRFLENGSARRVGSTRDYKVNVRLISATNRDLKTDSERGRFRLDLYYRLSEVILNVAPLRHRPDDVPDLALVFLREASVRMGKNFESLEPELIQKFQAYHWPGNVRELKQNIERLAIHYDGPIMRADWWSLPAMESGTPEGAGGSAYFPGQALVTHTGTTRPPFGGPQQGVSPSGFQSTSQPFMGMTGPLNKKEKLVLARDLLIQSGNDLTWTAAQLGIHPTTLYRWRKAGKL